MTKITLYSTQWCGDCRNAKRFLGRHQIEFHEIDIDENDSAAKQVIEWSGGRRVIPTFVIERDSEKEHRILHNPPIAKLAEELELN